MESMVDYYQSSEAYAEFLRACDRDEYLPYVELYRRFVTPEMGEVVDVGCGTGTSTLLLRERGLAAVGIDVSARFLPQDLPGFLAADFTDARQIADGAYAAAGCHDVIEHTEEPRRFLAELVRVVRPGGMVIVHAPNLTSPLVGARVVLDNLLGRTPYLGIGTLREACALFASNLWHSLRASCGVDAFRARRARLETGIICYDVDAIYWTNAAEIRRFLMAQGCEIVWYQKQARSLVGKLIARFAPDLAGQVCIVARKR